MSSGKTKAIVEAVGVGAVVASLIFVGIELQQARAVALAEIDVSLLDAQIQQRSLIAANGDLWVRGNRGEALSDTEALTFHQLVTTENDISFLNATRFLNLGEPELARSARHRFARFLYQNPGARAVWLAREDDLATFRNRLRQVGDVPTPWRDLLLADLALLDDGA